MYGDIYALPFSSGNFRNIIKGTGGRVMRFIDCLKNILDTVVWLLQSIIMPIVTTISAHCHCPCVVRRAVHGFPF